MKDLANRRQALAGVKAALPIVLGYLPLGFSFGFLAIKSGLTISQAVIMSLVCFSGAGQYVALGVVQVGAPAMMAVAANLLVNVRYFLFSSSLVPTYKGHIPPWLATLLSYALTDETYAVAFNHYKQNAPTAWYMGGLNLTAHLSWIFSTYLGAVLGAVISESEKWGLDFALPAMYICLLVLLITRRLDILIAFISAAICLIIGFLFPATLSNLSGLIIATLAAATLGVILHERRRN